MAYGSPSTSQADLEKGAVDMAELAHSRTAGGHPNDTSQPALPTVHRRFANPAPLGLFSFGTGIFLLSTFGVKAQGLEQPNIIVGVFIFFVGLCQYISGIMEFVAGNTFGATVFPTYASLGISYAIIFIPGTGIMAAYPSETEFNKATSIYLFAWMIPTTIYCVAALRSSIALLAALIFFDLELLVLAIGFILGNTPTLTAGYSIGYFAMFAAFWAGSAGLWAGDLTPINLPPGSLAKKD